MPLPACFRPRLACVALALGPLLTLHAADAGSGDPAPPPAASTTAAPAAPVDFDLRRSDPGKWIWNFPDAVPLVRHGEVHSQAMDRTVGYNIYLPPEYDAHPDWRFSVVYFLHGASANEKTGAALAKVVDAERAAGRTGPVVWVFVNGGPFSGYYDWPDANVKTETYFFDELIPAIESRYRVRTDRDGRAICGYSMGGNGAVRYATKYPDRFCAVNAIAGAFNTGGKLAATDNVDHWTRTHIDRIRGRLPMRFFVGADDRLLANQTAYLAVLNTLHLGYHLTVIEGRGHLIGEMWNEVCPDFVRTIGQRCAPPLSHD